MVLPQREKKGRNEGMRRKEADRRADRKNQQIETAMNTSRVI